MSLYKKMMVENIFDRSDMPQIKHKDLDRAIRILKNNSIKVTRGTIKPTELKPSQKEIYPEKVKAIMKRTTSLRGMKPLFIAEKNMILGGHHRWKAVAKKFPDNKIPYFKIHLPIIPAIKVLKKIEKAIYD